MKRKENKGGEGKEGTNDGEKRGELEILIVRMLMLFVALTTMMTWSFTSSEDAESMDRLGGEGACWDPSLVLLRQW
jgi:hypothetical protein